MTVAELVKNSLDYIVAPNIPDDGNVHDRCMSFNQFTAGTTDEDISLWLPPTEWAPNKNPPILRRFIEFRGKDREKLFRGEIVTFPDVKVMYHVMTVAQLEELHRLVCRIEDALAQTPNEGLGIPVAWWYGSRSNNTQYTPPMQDEPYRLRYVDQLSNPVKTAHFTN